MNPQELKTDASTAISPTRGRPTLAPQIPDHELLRRIGGGSYGEVWLARNVMGTDRAVKIVYRHTFDSERPYEREFAGIQKFEPISRTHESQVDILHIGRNDQAGYFYYVMELADDATDEDSRCSILDTGLPNPASSIQNPESSIQRPASSIHPDTYQPKTLRTELFHRGCLPVEECLQIGLSLTSALEHLHKHALVHRDIKPSNIIFVNGVPKLADLGLVADVGRTMSFVGTEGYLPPEGPGTRQADLYRMGKVLYEISTGKDRQEFPELPTNLEALSQKVELLEFNEVLLKACQVDPSKRYQTAQEMHADLLLLQNGKSVMHVRTLERRLAVTRRIGIAAVIVSLVAAAGFYLARRTAQIRTQDLVRLSTANGVRLMDDRDLFTSLVWFTEALRLDEGNRDRQYTHRLRIGSILQQSPKLAGLSFHNGLLWHLEFSPDGRRFVAASADRTARVWDARTGEPVTPPLRHGDEVVYASFSPDGSQVVTADQDATAQVWNAANGEPIGAPLKHKARYVWYAAFSPDGQRVLTVSSSWFFGPGPTPGEAVVWNATTGERVFALTNGAAISPDGQRILTLNLDPENKQFELAQVWDVNTGRPISPPMKQPIRNRASFSPDGQRVVLASDTAGARVWDARTGEPITPFLKDQGPIRAFFSHDNRWIVTVALGQTARVWDAATGEPVTPPLQHPNNGLEHAQFSPDNRYLLTSGRDGTVHLWKIVTGKSISVPLTHSYRVFRASFSPDGRQIAAGGSDGIVRLWNLAVAHGPAMQLTEDREVSCGAWRHRAAFSPDGLRVATMGDDAAVRVRDLQTGKAVFPPLWHSVLPSDTANWYSSVFFSHDGTRIGSQAYYNFDRRGQEKPYLWEARIWDAATGKQLTPTLQIEGAGFTGVAEAYFNPDCTRVLALRCANQVEVWDMATAKMVNPPLKHAGPVSPITGVSVRSAGFSPDGHRIVTTDFEKTGQVRSSHVQLWRAETGEKVGAELKISENTNASAGSGGSQFKVWVTYVGFSPDGKRVAAVTFDNSVHIIDAETGRLIVSIPSRGEGLQKAVFSPDGRRLLTEGNVSASRIWDAATGKPLTPLLHNVGSAGFSSFSLDGRLALTPGSVGWPRVWDAQTGQPITPHPPQHYRVGHAELSSDAHRVLMACGDGHARIWELQEDRHSVQDLALLARVLSGHEIDANGGLSPLDPAALSNAWHTLRLKDPAMFTANRDEDMNWHWNEAEDAARAKQWTGALFHLDRLIKANPTNGNYCLRRGRAHAALGNWKAAAADLGSAVRLGEAGRQVLRACALAQLGAGDAHDYEKTCESLLKTLEAPDGLRGGPDVLLICMLTPKPPAEISRIESMVEGGISDKAWAPHYHLAQGAILYRADRFDEAIAKLGDSMTVLSEQNRTVASAFLAMAHARLGHSDEAQQWLKKATDKMEEAFKEKPAASLTALDSPLWESRLKSDLLFAEAKRLVQP